MVKATKKYTFEPEYAVAPGETLRETMKALGMRQKELAIRTGLTVQSLIRIFKGEQPLPIALNWQWVLLPQCGII